MSLINNSAGFQIHSGNFYEVSGDMNLETRQHLLIQDPTRHDTGLRLHDGSTLTLEEGSDTGSRHGLSSVARNPRHEMGGRTAPYALSSRQRLGSGGSSTVGKHAHPELSTSASFSVQPRLGLRPVPERVKEFAPPAPLPSIDAQAPHLGNYPHSNNLAHLASLPPRSRKKYHSLPSRNTVRSASWERGPQGPHRGDPVGTESRSEDHLAHFTAEPSHAVHGGTFINAQNVNHHHSETGIQILHRTVALEALYDSAESFPQRRCHPETRTEILDGLYDWVIDNDSSYPICWLHGPAGAGKSAVMQTLCQRLHEADRLGGSFFFKRGHTTRGNARVLFATLAYQLALHHPELNGPISQSAETDPSVVGRGMDVQLWRLILEPCKSLEDAPPQILLIDGLDECEGHSAQQEILCLIQSTVTTHPRLLRVLIASRPEPHIRERFEELSFDGLYRSVNIEQAFEDIRIYLREEFSRIHRQHHETVGHIPTPWPTRDILEDLVDKSSGYFIYATTLIKFIDDRDFCPAQRLAAVVNNLPTECGTPFHALDELYSQILRGTPFQSRLLDILCAIVHGSMLQLSTKNIEELLGLDPGDVKITLRHLQSLLLVPQYETHLISLHHKSFRDFLMDPNRSGKFHLSLKQCKDLARSILQALSHSPANKPHANSNHMAQYVSLQINCI
ncbi:hypothetical protein FB451DRAFT_1527543 [Mycena latifolia]|nr:hypothetical protein FB451DRAFT_1527543 [Mycena latifolia]